MEILGWEHCEVGALWGGNIGVGALEVGALWGGSIVRGGVPWGWSTMGWEHCRRVTLWVGFTLGID